MALTNYWKKNIELLPVKQLQELQLKCLNNTIKQAFNAPYYRNVLTEKGIRELTSLKQITKLPFTTKADLRNNFPYGFLAVDLDETVRLHSSSGTTGNPTVVFHTQQDIEEWQNLIKRCLYMVGARSSDIFQNMMSYGLFTGGLGLHYGAEKLGMLTIPIGPGNSKRQIMFMKHFKTTVIHILPSYALRLAGLLREMEIDLDKDLHLRIALIGAEPHSEEIRRKIEKLLGLKAFNSYGLSEMCGPGVAFECELQQGLHVWEDHFYPEIIDPQTGEVLPEGEEGEIVLTTLTRQAMPLLRFRTGDLSKIIPEACACGRTHRLLQRIKGRDDDMLIINGVNIFPVQIEKALMRIPEIGTNYAIHVKKENYMDKLYINVELKKGISSGALKELEALQKRINEELKAEITVTPHVQLVQATSLPVQEGKAVRVYDHRAGN